MRIDQLITAVYFDPWLIKPQAHGGLRKCIEIAITDSFKNLHIDDRPTPPVKPRLNDGIATIEINGIIGKRISEFEKFFGIVDAGEIAEAIDDAAADNKVRGIFLDINSPGGMALGTGELPDAVVAARQLKPVMAFTDMMMASMAYYVGAGASVVYATRTSDIGSIGTYLVNEDTSQMFLNHGVKVDVIRSGEFKGMGIDGTTLTDTQRSYLQEFVDTLGSDFRSFVRANRGSIADETMRGQSFLAPEAKEVGLIDQVGSRDQAMNDLRELIQMAG